MRSPFTADWMSDMDDAVRSVPVRPADYLPANERQGTPYVPPTWCPWCGRKWPTGSMACPPCAERRGTLPKCVSCGEPIEGWSLKPWRDRQECTRCFTNMRAREARIAKERMMSTIARNTGGEEFTPAPPGSHVARCIQVVDLGTQPGSPKFPKWKHKVRIAWELCFESTDTDDGPKPMVVGQDYTCSLHENATLRMHLEAWRGRQFTEAELDAFDLKNVLGKACTVTLVHKKSQKGRTYANVAGVSGVPKGVEVPEQIHPSVHYEIEMKDSGTFADLPEWMQDIIKGSEEWGQRDDYLPGPAPEDDLIPF